MTNEKKQNPWRIVAISLLVGIPAVLAGAAVISRVSGEQEGADPARTASATVEHARTAATEECNHYAASARRDASRIVRDGVVGGAVGAGVGAAGGAIADGGKGAGKGAGIGAVLGATVGTLYGVNEENRKSEQAQAAYRHCMHEKGY